MCLWALIMVYMHAPQKGWAWVALTRGHLENLTDNFMQSWKFQFYFNTEKESNGSILQTKMLLLRATVPLTSPFVPNGQNFHP